MKTRHLTKMGRRRFLKNLEKVGVSSIALQFLSKDALADLTNSPNEEIPRISRFRHVNHSELSKSAKPKKEAVFYTIPRDKWAVVETAHDAAQRVDNKLEILDNTGLLSAGVRSITQNHHKQKAINIRYYTIENIKGEVIKRPDLRFEELKSTLPASVTGTAGEGKYAVQIDDIPLTFMNKTVSVDNSPLNLSQPLSHSDPTGGDDDSVYYDWKYRPLPGGCEVGNENTGERGTIATPAYDNDIDEYVLTTVCHLNNGNEGDLITQPNDNGKVGKSDKCAFSWWDIDGATIQVNTEYGNYDVKYAFAEDDGTYSTVDIYGTLAWDTIKDNEGNSDYNIQWRGTTTGHVGDTYIVEVNTDHYIWLNNELSAGDSGGPMYHVKFSGGDGKAYIAGVIAQGDTDGDSDGDYDTAGPWIGDLEDKFNLNV